MLLSCVQSHVTFGDVRDNVRRAEVWLQQAAARSLDLVVLPECMLTGYGFESREEALPHALSIDDPVWQSLIAICRSSGQLHAVIGFLEREETESQTRLYNATALIGPSGVIGTYRKVHLPHLGVDRFVDRGNRPYAVHQAGDARVGLAICYDCSFPEPMRVLGLAGADIIALSTNWPAAAARTAEIVPPARSMENHLFFLAANRVGSERGFRYCGSSSICGPDGVELARAGTDDEQMLVAEVDLSQARNKRIERTPGAHVIDRFADRQPHFYESVSAPQRGGCERH
ncbi:MAG: carbon-nitrogen hydrolase family protein [Planctomycetaceae bacterium]